MRNLTPRDSTQNNLQGASYQASARPVIKSAVGLYQFSPESVVRPFTEKGIAHVVRTAHENDMRVRVMGALHSAVPLAATEGICISLDRYNRVLSVKGNLVTVQAGIRLHELNDALATYGLALPTLGTIALQTVAGAISTGTHGGSLQRTSLSGYVEAMRMVRADGSVVEVEKGQSEFEGCAIALGLLGVISTVTFRCVPAFCLRSEIESLPMAELLERFDEIHTRNEYVDMRYSPITDKAHVVRMNRTQEPIANGGWQPGSSNRISHALTDTTNKLAQRLFLTHKVNWLQRWGIARYDRAIYTGAYGRSDFVLTHFDVTSTDLLANDERSQLDPVADMEVAVPYDLACEALATLRDYFQRSQRFPCMHIHLRTQAAESFWLSPTQGDRICWIEFWEYPITGHFFAEMMALLAPFEPRGHWGKQLPNEPSQLYAEWDKFAALKQAWDAQGTFSNNYLNRYFKPLSSYARV